MRYTNTVLHTMERLAGWIGVIPRILVGVPGLCALLMQIGSAVHPARATMLLGQETPLQQSFDLHVPMPATPVPMADSLRLVYELHLTNFTRVPLVLQQVEALDVEGATVIAEVRGAALDRRLSGSFLPRLYGRRVGLYLPCLSFS